MSEFGLVRFVFIFWVFIPMTVMVNGKAPVLTEIEMSHPPPKIIRTCCAFGVDISIARIPFVRKTDVISEAEIGPHHYLGNKEEGNGIIYTRHGGFIDLGHLRDYADWTAYLYNFILSAPETNEGLVLNLESEGGDKTIVIGNIQRISKSEIAELAGSIAYELSVWHEIATWYGSSYIPMIPERYSSFSPEDLYSNLLGVNLGIQAIQSDLPFEEAVTVLLKEKLDSLGVVQSYEETYAAMELVENIWWTRKKAIPAGNILLQRYLDTNTFLVPWLVPSDDNKQLPYVIYKSDPRLSDLYEIRIKFNRKNVLESVGLYEETITQNDFPWLISAIEEDLRKEEIKNYEKLRKAQYKKV